jgi:hypothetical protein
MDYAAAIERVYTHLEDDHVDRAVMTCLRIARHVRDYMFTAIFLREMYPVRREFARVLHDDMSHLNDEARRFLNEKSLDRWLEIHTLDSGTLPNTDDDGEDRNVLAIAVGEMDAELDQCERWINDLAIPPGMGEYDTAAFTDRYVGRKQMMRRRIKGIQTVKQRIRTLCLNYAIRIERQLLAQVKSQSFLEQTQNEVNNYFMAHAEDVYKKLQSAAQLVDSTNPEDSSLLLTQVRRAISVVADHFYPPVDDLVICSDGKKRALGKEQYLNRLQEYLATTFAQSSANELLRAEYEYLAVFTRRLNDVASKGVHDSVDAQEGKQGLIGLYLFLYNLVSRLQGKDVATQPKSETV